MDYILETKNLTKIYRKKKIIDDLNIKIRPGHIFALLGLNGAGKTTTIKLLLGLTTPTTGSISYFNKNFLTSKSEILPKIGGLIEKPGFYNDLTSFENLELITNIVGFHKKDYIDEIIDLVELMPFRNIKFKKLNTSQKQKLAIGRALLNNPDILILDEPINGLDPISINEMRILLVRLAKEKNITIFISSHILSEIEKIADTIAVLHKGKILESIDTDKIDKKYKNRIIVKTSDPFRSSELLTSSGYDCAVRELDEINIYEHEKLISVILKILVENDINVEEIYSKEFTLERYFIDMINNN